MATTRELKRRIASITNTQKITRAMEMVASVKMKKARQQMLGARPFAERLREIAAHLRASMSAGSSSLMIPRDVKTVNLVVATSDKGLCGGFNAYVCRKAMDFIRERPDKQVRLTVFGRKGRDFFTRRKLDLIDCYIDVFHKPHYDDASRAAGKLIDDFLRGVTDECWVLNNELSGAVSQKPVLRRLLPVEPPAQAPDTQPEYILEPEEDAVVDALLFRYIHFQIWSVFLESFAAEQASRMTAMNSATKNAGDLIDQCSLLYNKLRQGSITRELLEIVSGADALQ
jgi:F-type H+-transporting ATPase subunit gamma